MLMHPDEYRVMFETEDNYWWYRGLRTLVQNVLARYAPREVAILDAGCGTGANLQMMQRYGHAIGIDLSAQAIEFCRARGIPNDRAFQASLTGLPFCANLFGLVVSFDVICNIPDDTQALSEIARVLKPGGRLITQLPAYQWLWSTHDVAVGHQRRYSSADLRVKVEKAGLVVERLTHTNALLLPISVTNRLVRRGGLENGSVHSDLTTHVPGWLNRILSGIATAEMQAVSRVDLPVGLSVLVIAVKP